MANNKNEIGKKLPYAIPVEGSLGLLAYGDIGLRAWREVKKKSKEEKNTNEKK